MDSGGRVGNAWAICPRIGDNLGKLGLIPNMVSCRMTGRLKVGILRNLPSEEEPAYDQLVGEVMAHQGYDR